MLYKSGVSRFYRGNLSNGPNLCVVLMAPLGIAYLVALTVAIEGSVPSDRGEGGF